MTHFLFNGNDGTVINKTSTKEENLIIDSILSVMTPTKLEDGDRLFPLDDSADSFIETKKTNSNSLKYNKECINTCYIISEGCLESPNGQTLTSEETAHCINPLALVTGCADDMSEETRELKAKGTCVVWGLKVRSNFFFLFFFIYEHYTKHIYTFIIIFPNM